PTTVISRLSLHNALPISDAAVADVRGFHYQFFRHFTLQTEVPLLYPARPACIGIQVVVRRGDRARRGARSRIESYFVEIRGIVKDRKSTRLNSSHVSISY